MDITAELDEMRKAIRGCSLVAFTDLTSKLVLSTSAAAAPMQEEMNALSEAAGLALDGAFAEGAAPVWGGEEPAELAILMTGEDARLFLRSQANPAEALVCVCGATTDLSEAAEAARATLDRIVSAG
ncbi:MAG: hypothetical protein QNJ20_18575 [Paracoccaceae bacterium]|nr:hypothetical protein [Paracoccaceae bacterium]